MIDLVPELIITRMFDAPRDLVFKAFTEPDSVLEWWGPKGFKLEVIRMDVRQGGTFHYSMETPDGKLMWGKFVYREVARPEKLVYVSSFSDADGNVTPNPMVPEMPLRILNTVLFNEINGKTELTLRGGPLDASEQELQTFEWSTRAMHGGFKGTFEKLDRYLARIQKRGVTSEMGIAGPPDEG